MLASRARTNERMQRQQELDRRASKNSQVHDLQDAIESNHKHMHLIIHMPPKLDSGQTAESDPS